MKRALAILLLLANPAFAQHSATLTWSVSTATATGATIAGYTPQKASSCTGTFTPLQTALVAALTATDTNVTAGQSVCYEVTATDSLGNVSGPSNQVLVTIPGGATAPVTGIYVLGGTTNSYTDPSGNVWTGQTEFTGGTNATPVTHAISNTTTPTLFQFEYYEKSMTGKFTGLVAGAPYVVTLNEAELYWTATGKRVFSATVNGTALFTNLDLYKDSGGEYIADPKSGTFTADSTGAITIAMTASVDNAKFDSISIVAAGPSVSISPTSASIVEGGTVQFSAAESGTTAAIAWTSSGGSVTSSGLFTAPAAPGSYTVMATAGTASATANVTVTAPPPTVALTCTPGAAGSGGGTCAYSSANVPSGTAATVSITTDGVSASSATTIP